MCRYECCNYLVLNSIGFFNNNNFKKLDFYKLGHVTLMPWVMNSSQAFTIVEFVNNPKYSSTRDTPRLDWLNERSKLKSGLICTLKQTLYFLSVLLTVVSDSWSPDMWIRSLAASGCALGVLGAVAREFVCLLEDLYSRMIRMTCLSICNDMAALSKNRWSQCFDPSRYLVEFSLYRVELHHLGCWYACTALLCAVLYRMLHLHVMR